MASKSGVESPQDSTFDGFERQLPDNCVEYLLFIDVHQDTRRQLSQIETIRKAALQLSNTLARDYIWQKDEFNLELKTENGKAARSPQP